MAGVLRQQGARCYAQRRRKRNQTDCHRGKARKGHNIGVTIAIPLAAPQIVYVKCALRA